MSPSQVRASPLSHLKPSGAKRTNDAGYFVIDPSLDRSDQLVRSRVPLQSRHKRFFYKRPVPNAVFQTKKGEIKLNLSTTNGGAEPKRAYVQVQSNSGAIHASLVSPSVPAATLSGRPNLIPCSLPFHHPNTSASKPPQKTATSSSSSRPPTTAPSTSTPPARATP